MSNAISKSFYAEEPKLNNCQYSLRGLLIAVFSIFLYLYLRMAWVVDVNMYAARPGGDASAVASIIMPPDFHISKFVVFLLIAWFARTRVSVNAIGFMRALLLVFFLSYAIFPALIQFSTIPVVLLWLQKLALLLFLWLIVNYIACWLPKSAMFVFVPMLMFFVPDAASLNSTVVMFMHHNSRSFVAYMLIAGVVAIILSWLLYSKTSPYESVKTDPVEKPWQVFQAAYFWQAACILILAVFAIDLLTSQFLSTKLIIRSGSDLSTAVFAFSVLFTVIKKRLRISSYIMFFATAIVLACSVYNFSDTNLQSLQLLTMTCLGVAFLAYGYYYFAAYKTWPWDFAVLFTLVSVVTALSGSTMLSITTNLSAHMIGFIAAACCAGIAILLRTSSLDDKTLLPMQLWPTLKRMLSGEASIGRAFWGAGFYMLLFSMLLLSLSRSLLSWHSALVYFYGLTFAVLSGLWVICVWRCSSRSGSFVRYCSRMYTILIAMFFIGGYIYTILKAL